MKSIATATLPISGKLKIALLILGFCIIGGTLWYTHDLVQQLQKKEQEVADLYAHSLEYIANAPAGGGDYSFVFGEIIKAIDFPIVETNEANTEVKAFRNVQFDSSLAADQRDKFILTLLPDMDAAHHPIVVAYQDTIILSHIHFGESELISKLRWLPYVELSIVAVFILIGYISFSYIKRSEQSNIWVGMARETAHQLGTPISSMMGWVELLRGQTQDPHALETINDMESDLVRLQKIADRFSKIGSKPDLREESVEEIIGKVVEYFGRRIPHTGKKVQLSIAAAGPVKVPINRELFEWVIENLTKNALDAMESGIGTITYTITESGQYVFIDVSDTGKGIDIKHRNDVFRPGFSTKKRGWGLGLSLSKRIVESYHRGKLILKESKPGVGTTFRIRLDK